MTAVAQFSPTHSWNDDPLPSRTACLPWIPYGSFLPPLNSYRIEGEEEAFPRHIPTQPPSLPPNPAPLAHEQPPLERHRSAELTDVVESAFDDMDSALSARNARRDRHPWPEPSPAASEPPLRPPRVDHYYRLNGEEQAWLDHEFEMEYEMEYEMEVASRTGSIDDRADNMDEETEDAFVRDLLLQHPQLNEAEARWLWQERERARG